MEDTNFSRTKILLEINSGEKFILSSYKERVLRCYVAECLALEIALASIFVDNVRFAMWIETCDSYLVENLYEEVKASVLTEDREAA